VKFAAFEALYDGKEDAGLVAVGLLKESDRKIGEKSVNDFFFRIEIPALLSIMTGGSKDTFVAGINDLVNGNESQGLIPVSEKIERGTKARELLAEYKAARQQNDTERAGTIAAMFRDRDFVDNYFRYFGYAFLNKADDVIPDVKLAFYTFHIMVMLGFLFILEFALALFFLFRGTLPVASSLMNR